jgi:tetratricopeptide (TPR) repeat protein
MVKGGGVITGLVVDSGGFEVLAGGERVGPRRLVGPGDVDLLKGLASRYVRAVHARSGDDVLAGIGRELYRWLDGDAGQLTSLLEQAAAPLVLEVQGPRSPSDPAWAVLRAPFELLARPDGGFLAEEELTRFCVARRLGPTVQRPALDQFRLGLAFMASSPRGQVELDFEAEEAAILGAVGEGRVDLLVEDTGDPEQLAHRLAALDGMPVVHLSCHGLNNWRDPGKPGAPGVPILAMEDDTGGGRLTTAADLAGLLTAMPRLLFVSACLTATGAGDAHLPPGTSHKGDPGTAGNGGLVAHSLATALVTAGVPAVIGWDGSVIDSAATLFAERLYQRLADKADLAVAVGDARRVLLESGEPVVRADWHLARLWLGPAGGGPLVTGTRKRSLVTATRGTKTFLDIAQRQVPVAAPDMFVGRRAELQQALRVLRAGDRAGVLLHGQGRLGKSSLAARIADRLPDHAVAVVYGDYSALGILDAVAAAVRDIPAAREIIKAGLPVVRQRPEAIEEVLTDLLAGPCAQSGDARSKPLLLIIDDVEQVLAANPDGPHRVNAEEAPVLAAVLRAFDPGRTDSRLLLTSRFTFRLNGLEDRLEPVQLRPLSLVAQRKLQRRQQALTPPDRQAARVELAERAVRVSRGNPGLQDLIGLRLVYGEQVDPQRAEAVVTGMEDYLRQGDLPADTEVRAYLENLALDALLDEAGASNVELLRAATLFTLPVPEPVIGVLARETGGSVARLRGLGLLVPYPDLYDPAHLALAADPLITGRIEQLSATERAARAAATVGPLFAAWGGVAPQPRRYPTLDLQLTRLALLGDEPIVAAACAPGGVSELRDGPAADASRLGQDAIGLLDRHSRAVPLSLLRRTADAALTSGDGATGDALQDRAAQQAEAGNDDGADPLDRARVVAEQGRRLITRGEPERAGQLLQQAHQLFTAEGSEAEAAAAMGEIANIAYDRGDYDEALRIRQEVQLPVYERLGDTRATAITWGQIADIAYQRGDYDEALRIRHEVQLPAFERLGDTREAALAWGKVADIAYQRGDYDEALRIRQEVQLPAFERLGDTRATAITWGQIADIAYQRGNYDEALRIRHEIELPAFERVGDTRESALAWGGIADIAYRRGDYDEALRIRHEVQLSVYERLGDTQSIAVTWGQIADIAYQRGNYDEAAELQGRRLAVNRQLGDAEGIAAASYDLARIDLARQDYQSAFPRLAESWKLFSQLRRPDGIAAVGWALGQLLAAAGQTDQAREVLGDTRAAATQIGRTDIAQRASDLLGQLPPPEGET